MKVYHGSAILRNDGLDASTGKVDLNAGVGVQVTLRINSTQALAIIFDLDSVGMANPLTTDSNGNYSFKVADGVYDITVNEGTANEVTIEGVEIFEAVQISPAIYADTASGIAATSIGDYFSVPAPEVNSYLTLYLHDTGGLATSIKTYPSLAYVNQVNADLLFTSQQQALGVISSQKTGGDIVITGVNAVVTIPPGWRLLRNGTYIDLPAFSGAVNSVEALTYNPSTNLYSVDAVTAFDNRVSIIVLYVIQGHIFSPHPDVADLLSYQYEINDMVFDKKGEPLLSFSGNDANITFQAGSRVITNDVFEDIPIGAAPTLSSLEGLYFNINDQTLSVSLFSARKAANQVLLCVNISGQLSSAFPKFHASLSNSVPYGDVAFTSDDLDITIANGTGTERLVTFKAGSRLIGGVNDSTFFDLPTTQMSILGNKVLLANKTTGALTQIDLPDNLQPPFGIPSGEYELIYNFNGTLSSSNPRLNSMITNALTPEVGRFSDGLYFPDDNFIVLDNVDGSKNVTIDFPAFRYVDETGVYVVGAQSGVTVNQLKAVFLDLDTLLFIVNANSNAYDADPRKILVAYNVNAYINSPISPMQKQLDNVVNIDNVDQTGYKLTEITVGAGETYTTLTAMYAAITDATIHNRYRILLLAGTYIEVGPNGFGLEMKDYIYVYGASRNTCFLYGPEAPTPATTFNYDVIHKVATCLLMGVTLVAYKNKYAVHSDLDANNFHFTMQNCITRHNGSEHPSNVYWDIGIGTRNSQHLTFIDVEMQGYGLRIHGPTGESTRNATHGLDGWGLDVIGCKIHRLDLEDFLEYYKSEIKIEGCVIDEVELWVDPTWYNANPANPFMNRGWKNIGQGSTYSGNEIGIVLYRDAGTLATIGGRYLVPTVNKFCYNVGGAISKGQAVKRVADIAKAVSATFEQTHDRIDSWGAGGILLGWSEDVISATSHGYVHYSGEPIALVSSGAGAIAFGDKLVLNSSGELTNWISGEYHANAIDVLSAGGGLLKVSKA